MKASGFLKEQLGKDIKNVTKLFDQIAQEHQDNKGRVSDEEAESDDDQEETKGEEEQKQQNDAQKAISEDGNESHEGESSDE